MSTTVRNIPQMQLPSVPDPIPNINASILLARVLSIAKIHPFYSTALYPPNDDAFEAAMKEATTLVADDELKMRPLLTKASLYDTIKRLVQDTSPDNTYRHNVYTSVTGGGGTSSKYLFFATNAIENRRHRAYFGQMLHSLGVIERGDWVLTTHFSGELYRSLDLMCEILENAGASVLAAGNHVSPSKVVQLLQDFNVNVLTGAGSQIISIVHHISNMSTGRDAIKLNKVIYTSEVLTAAQKSHIVAVLGPVKIYSILGSAEAGPYGVSSPDLISSEPAANYTDFLVDTRMIHIEIFPPCSVAGDDIPTAIPEGELGIITQTSLVRLRNPLVRYVTGDIGSLLPLSEDAGSPIPKTYQPHLRVLRLQGRDRRFSFAWDGYDFEFETLSAVMAEHELEILQWQVILDTMEMSKEVSLEARVLSSRKSEEREVISDRLKIYFLVYPMNQHKFRITFVNNIAEFELSQTGRKVMNFVDRQK